MRTILFAFLLLVLNTAIYGQVTPEKYNAAVDFLNCKAIEHVLSGLGQLAEYETLYTCEKEFYFDKTTEFLANKGGHKVTIDLAEEIQKLKSESYNSQWNADQVIAFLSEGVFDNQEKYPALFNFAKNRNDDLKKRPLFTIFVRDLKSDLKKLLESDGKASSSPSPSPSPSSSTSTSPIESLLPSIWGNLLVYSIPILFLFIAFAIWRIISLEQRVGNLIEQNQVTIEHEKWNLKVLVLDLRKKIGSIQTELQKLRKDPGGSTSLTSAQAQEMAAKFDPQDKRAKETAVKNEITDIHTEMTFQEPTSIFAEESEEKEVKGNVFYLSNPNEDGTFNDSSASTSYKPAASIYKFTKASDGRAQFEIDTNEGAIKLALRNPDRVIDPVCEPLNSYDSNAQTIITKRNGIAILEGDKWVVKTKAQIFYK